MDGDIRRWRICLPTVRTVWAVCKLTALIDTRVLPLSQAATFIFVLLKGQHRYYSAQFLQFLYVLTNVKVVRKRVFRFVDNEWKSTIWFHCLITFRYLQYQKTRMLPTFWRSRTTTLHGCARKQESRVKRRRVLKAKSVIYSVRWEEASCSAEIQLVVHWLKHYSLFIFCFIGL